VKESCIDIAFNTLGMRNSTAVKLGSGIKHHLAHPHLMGKMMWLLKDGQVPNPKKAALYKVLFCDGKSKCAEIMDPSNQKCKCWFTLKWVISKDDLTRALIFIKGGHST
jgi:hypothetical protein